MYIREIFQVGVSKWRKSEVYKQDKGCHLFHILRPWCYSLLQTRLKFPLMKLIARLTREHILGKFATFIFFLDPSAPHLCSLLAECLSKKHVPED
jgi:hypothetical protein